MLLSKKFVSDYIDLPEELTIEKIAEDIEVEIHDGKQPVYPYLMSVE